jgi:hypothetical protein
MAPPLLPITRLIACPACAEHFKSNESQCPHCGVDNRSAEGRTARAATAVLMGLMLSGCPDKEPEPSGTGTDTGTGTGSGTDTDGASSTGTGTGTDTDASGTTFMPEPEYGVPVTTSGPEPDYGVPGTSTGDTTTTTTTTTTTSGGEPLYGAGST